MSSRFTAEPIIIQDPKESYSILHTDKLYVACKIVARPAARVTWLYEDDRLPPRAVDHIETHVVYSRVYTLTISVLTWNRKLRRDDPRRVQAAGKYRCSAENAAGFAESKETSLTMYGKRNRPIRLNR